MKVYTYYTQVPELNPVEQQKLLRFWAESWALHGWQPVILTPDNARQNPRCEELAAVFSRLPTINPKQYELACFMRWVAMAAVGGGLMTDYDVINFGLREHDLPQGNDGPLVSILGDHNPCPCAVAGTEEQFKNTLQLFVDYELAEHNKEQGQPHISDQNIIQARAEEFRPHIYDLCPEYTARHWRAAKMVHFSHGACDGHDRVAVARKAMRNGR